MIAVYNISLICLAKDEDTAEVKLNLKELGLARKLKNS